MDGAANLVGNAMKTKMSLWLRRWWIRQLIKFADRAEERLHDWQVKLRHELVPVHLPVESASAARPERPAVPSFDPFPQDELLRHRIPRRTARSGEPQRSAKSPRRRPTAAEFDLRFSR
jgi:hypothetical protein